MRHAKSSWKDASLSDHQRPLNKRGIRDAPRMGNFLNEHDLIPDVILCSTANRAQLTVKYLLTTCDFEGDEQYFDDLYHSDVSTYLGILQWLETEIELPMIVGHNPDMNHFLYSICDEYVHMPTAAIAYISLDCQDWSELNLEFEGKLINLWKPRLIS